MDRRLFLAALALPAAAAAQQTAEPEAPLVRSRAIVDALRSRDIVLDQPGRPPRPPAIDLQVQFTFGSAELLPQGRRQLDELAIALGDRALEGAAFELAGHTDAVGGYAYNMRLSLERAEAVKRYLIAAHRLSPARLYPIGFGFTRLADPARPESALNRRVEVRRLVAAAPAPAPGGQLVPTPR